MFREFIARLGSTINKLAGTVIDTVHAAIGALTPSRPASAGFFTPIVPTEFKNAMHVGKRYRLTSDHAPIFSLFTFFGLR